MRWRPASPSATSVNDDEGDGWRVGLGASDDGEDTAAEVLGDDVLAAPCSPPMQPASVNAATTAARSGRAATARPGRAGVGGITPTSLARPTGPTALAPGSGASRPVPPGHPRDLPALAHREGMHERPGVRDDDRRPADREEVGPGCCGPCPQRSVRLTARPVDLEVASREGGSHVWRQRLQLIERPALGDPDVGLSPPLVEFRSCDRAASTMADAVATSATRRARHDAKVGRSVARLSTPRVGVPRRDRSVTVADR